ncbi:hypothetical protein E3U43_006510 [Larimichthys crocea]|uniref:Uncharacterized protein n=1 Tax=Larimichthys crocea TaxID=215358 RepID=A0ACD3RK75_LARCR|nr:hypothetical protein E3U43_006510 [Larimichthys crocea]
MRKQRSRKSQDFTSRAWTGGSGSALVLEKEMQSEQMDQQGGTKTSFFPLLVLFLFVTLIRLEKGNRWIQSGVTFNYINFFLRTVVHYKTVSAVRAPPSNTTGYDDTPALR